MQKKEAFATLNINDYDCTNMKTRNWIFKKVLQKEVTLVTGSLQLVQLAIQKQVLQGNPRDKEKDKTIRRENRKVEA